MTGAHLDPDSDTDADPTDDGAPLDADLDQPTQHDGPVDYAHAHTLYRAAGWTGPLPLPPGRKYPPPDGWTGYHGADPSGADSWAWATDPPPPGEADYRGTRQLALRLPAGVVGVDVDDYAGKHGATTIRHAITAYGALPRTWRSTARGAGQPSGILFYRVPHDVAFPGVLKFPELQLGDVELIQRHHRYAVAWPSVHPDTDTPYLWYRPDGQIADRIPHIDELPALPAGWLDGLARDLTPGAQAADDASVQAFARAHAGGDNTGALTAIVGKYQANARDVNVSRHDAMHEAACWAAREAALGRYPAAEAVRQLRGAFVHDVTTGPAARRGFTALDARNEFARSWAWAVAQANAMTPDQAAARAARHHDVGGQAGGRVLSRGNTVSTLAGHDGNTGAHALVEPPAGRHISPPNSGDDTRVDVAAHLDPDDVAELERAEFELAVEGRIRMDDIRDTARQRRAARDREPVRALAWDAFLDAPQPEYLIDGMLYRGSTSKVFGAPGSTKSYLLLDLALHLAHGRPWMGQDIDRTVVHYLAAEGQAVNVARTLGWLHTHQVDRAEGRGWFHMYPDGVLLTDAGVDGYLDDVARDQPGLVILDTKNAMMDGEENSASDSAVMIRAMRKIRDAAGGACVVLVDHTGMGDTSRGRGSNAVEAAMDTEVKVECDRDTRIVSATVTRDKASEPGRLWSYRLRRVDGTIPGLRDGATQPAYVAPLTEAEAKTSGPLRSTSAWFDDEHGQVPDVLVKTAQHGREAARDAFRVLRFVNDPDGQTRAQITAALKEQNRPRPHAPASVSRGLALLVDLGVADKDGQRYVLAEQYRPVEL